ncbi:hypothetical protein BC939DRAFT_509359 [Gamsiella multidivaricata]|uniref:uncharacterized protein n=1 Tax=Gamsiella multidivaricata TaxID=101098 RepID=UPI00222053E3|nr:uncharacterized protein BC939DRAFT_509359 [Gamsiella multidivaricata]KAI7832851.1 hypothetical protein BC939DRAFT_509359 [Gamsiella multidivaricata]
MTVMTTCNQTNSSPSAIRCAVSYRKLATQSTRPVSKISKEHTDLVCYPRKAHVQPLWTPIRSWNARNSSTASGTAFSPTIEDVEGVGPATIGITTLSTLRVTKLRTLSSHINSSSSHSPNSQTTLTKIFSKPKATHTGDAVGAAAEGRQPTLSRWTAIPIQCRSKLSQCFANFYSESWYSQTSDPITLGLCMNVLWPL